MKKWFSYLLPYRLKKYESEVNGVLEINLINGVKTLDSTTSNYSYGSLQKVLYKGLKSAGFNDAIESVLVLGLGGGCIVETIRQHYHNNCPITLVDIDPVMIEIADKDFNLYAYGNIEMIASDAFTFVRDVKEQFQCIVVDLFIGNTIPYIFTQPEFIHLLDKCLQNQGKIIFNTMRESLDPADFNQIFATFRNMGYQLHLEKKVEGYNDLIIAMKTINQE